MTDKRNPNAVSSAVDHPIQIRGAGPRLYRGTAGGALRAASDRRTAPNAAWESKATASGPWMGGGLLIAFGGQKNGRKMGIK